MNIKPKAAELAAVVICVSRKRLPNDSNPKIERDFASVRLWLKDAVVELALMTDIERETWFGSRREMIRRRIHVNERYADYVALSLPKDIVESFRFPSGVAGTVERRLAITLSFLAPPETFFLTAVTHMEVSLASSSL